MAKGAEVGIQRGQIVCPMCLSLALIRTVEKWRHVEWVWWCGCGWASETHVSPYDTASLLQRFSNWRKLNNWPE